MTNFIPVSHDGKSVRPAIIVAILIAFFLFATSAGVTGSNSGGSSDSSFSEDQAQWVSGTISNTIVSSELFQHLDPIGEPTTISSTNIASSSVCCGLIPTNPILELVVTTTMTPVPKIRPQIFNGSDFLRSNGNLTSIVFDSPTGNSCLVTLSLNTTGEFLDNSLLSLNIRPPTGGGHFAYTFIIANDRDNTNYTNTFPAGSFQLELTNMNNPRIYVDIRYSWNAVC